jgi:hypothetical protein
MGALGQTALRADRSRCLRSIGRSVTKAAKESDARGIQLAFDRPRGGTRRVFRRHRHAVIGRIGFGAAGLGISCFGIPGRVGLPRTVRGRPECRRWRVSACIQ